MPDGARAVEAAGGGQVRPLVPAARGPRAAAVHALRGRQLQQGHRGRQGGRLQGEKTDYHIDLRP